MELGSTKFANLSSTPESLVDVNEQIWAAFWQNAFATSVRCVPRYWDVPRPMKAFNRDWTTAAVQPSNPMKYRKWHTVQRNIVPIVLLRVYITVAQILLHCRTELCKRGNVILSINCSQQSSSYGNIKSSSCCWFNNMYHRYFWPPQVYSKAAMNIRSCVTHIIIFGRLMQSCSSHIVCHCGREILCLSHTTVCSWNMIP